MTQGKQDSLRSFLAEKLSGEHWGAVQEVLAPFYEAIQRSTPLPLAIKDGLTQKGVLAVLREAWGSEAVREVILFSRREHQAKIKTHRGSLWDNLKERFGRGVFGLEQSEITALALLMYQSLGVSPWDSVGVVLFIYLGLVLTEQEDQILKLEPLARLLPYALPVGEIQDQPGAWLVLVD